jgi:exoribonuclease R
VPHHPLVLSEGAASLLADGRVRPAAVWEITLDTDGAVTSAHVARGLVRNRAQLAYEAVQAQLDAGTADGVMVRLAEVGRLRQAQEAARGGVSLNVPEQVAERTEAGWRLGFRRPAPVELWNAQISLLTGTAAARLMLDGGVGLLRTLAAALPENLDRLHRVAHGLKIAWPDALGYPDFVRSLDPAKAKHLAMLNACRSLFRGAGYAPVDRARPGVTPPELVHAAVALPYAHVTAPLRRLVDRFGAECCLAISAGVAAPDWVRDALPALPALMAQSGAVAGQVEAAALNLLEALVLQDHVGETFGATVVATRGRDKATIQLHDPAVEASLAGRAKLGADIEVRLAAVDVAAPSVRFDVA